MTTKWITAAPMERCQRGTKHALDAVPSRGLRRAGRRRFGLARKRRLVHGASAAAGEEQAERHESGARRRDEDALRDLERPASLVRFFFLSVFLFFFGCLARLPLLFGVFGPLFEVAVRGIRVPVEDGGGLRPRQAVARLLPSR